ncbi:MAG: hypothetical protein QM660_10885 [Dysgonomonas sp.]
MGNKPSKLKKTDKRIGNFIISKYGNELQYIKVSKAAGNWSETFRSDNEFYRQLDEMLKATDEQSEKYLHSLFITHMIVCNGGKDWQFMQDVLDANKRMVERLNPNTETSEEENQQIINEEKEKHENK